MVSMAGSKGCIEKAREIEIEDDEKEADNQEEN